MLPDRELRGNLRAKTFRVSGAVEEITHVNVLSQ